MKKLVTWVILFALNANVFASTGSMQGLEKAINEYQYAVTVEWDQQDQKEKELISLAFAEKLQSLIQEQGLTKEEINLVIEKKMKDKNQLAMMKAKLALLSEASSAHEMVKLLSENSTGLYAQGASWNGSAEEILIYGGLALLVGAMIWFYATHECVATGEEWRCDSSYDDYGSSSVCRWVTVCTAYAKKK